MTAWRGRPLVDRRGEGDERDLVPIFPMGPRGARGNGRGRHLASMARRPTLTFDAAPARPPPGAAGAPTGFAYSFSQWSK